MLFEDSGNLVWCLELFVDVKAFAYDVVSEIFFVSVFICVLDICCKINLYDDGLFRRVKEVLDLLEVDVVGVNSRFAFFV